jgi:Fic family protein
MSLSCKKNKSFPFACGSRASCTRNHDRSKRTPRITWAFPNDQNWIGKPGSTAATASYSPPPGEVEPALGGWEKFLHESKLPPLVTIGLAHYQFKAIHPFLDGNGRVGRLLITLFLIERQILPTLLLYLSAFFEASRRDYYDNLRGISERGAWNDWLEYFLLGVARMSEDALSRATRINQLLAQWQRKVSGDSTNNPLRVVELLSANPFLTTKGASGALGIAFTTAQRTSRRKKRTVCPATIGVGAGDGRSLRTRAVSDRARILLGTSPEFC